MPTTWPHIPPRDNVTDPIRDELAARNGTPCLDTLLKRFPPTPGEPAFDPAEVERHANQLCPALTINTGHPYLDRSVRIGLAHIDVTFHGDHPKYGVKHYADERHDGFPPTIIAVIDALSAWGLHARASQLFNYWLQTFIKADGTIAYYGPSISEYGQLLHTAALLHQRGGPAPWWKHGQPVLTRLANYLLALCDHAQQTDDLIPGIPEADISSADPNNLSDTAHSEANRYFHNNAWVARGLTCWADLLATTSPPPNTLATIRTHAQNLAQRTLRIIRQTWPTDPDAWWYSPQVEPVPTPADLTASTAAAYTNYRYWPELLATGILPAPLAHRLVDARLSAAGQHCGTTRFFDRIDDWPIADYLHALWTLGRTQDFRLTLYGHTVLNQAADHLTAYEQITLPPCQEVAAYCLSCQLIPARTAPHLNT